MTEIIATEVFDHFDKTYLLDRLKGSLTGPVIRITETVHDGTRKGRYVVEIDAIVLKHIQELIQAPVVRDTAGEPDRVFKRLRLTAEARDKIVRSYLRGVSASDLALQLGCTVEDVVRVLVARGIAIVDQTPPIKWKSERSTQGKRNAVAKPTRTPSPKPAPFLSNAPWTDADDTALANLHKRGASILGLVSKFRRAPSFIRARLQKLGLID